MNKDIYIYIVVPLPATYGGMNVFLNACTQS